jgi:hypothetical protein
MASARDVVGLDLMNCGARRIRTVVIDAALTTYRIRASGRAAKVSGLRPRGTGRPPEADKRIASIRYSSSEARESRTVSPSAHKPSCGVLHVFASDRVFATRCRPTCSPDESLNESYPECAVQL